MKRVIVVGGAGFLGSHVVEALLEKGCEVMSYDCLMPQVHPNSPNWPEYQKVLATEGGPLTLHFGDVRDMRALRYALDTFQPDTVVHLAALVGVAQGNHRIAEYVSANVTGTAILLQAVADYNLATKETMEHGRALMEATVTPEEGQTQEEANAKYLERIQPELDKLLRAPNTPIEQVLVAGSMSAYGEGAYLLSGDAGGQDFGIVRPPSDWIPGALTDPDGVVCYDAPDMEPTATPETVRLNPVSVYAWTKEQQEVLALLIGKLRGIPVKVARFFNCFGPNQSLTNPYTGIAAIFSARVLAGLDPIIFEDGMQRRDFTHASDVASAVLCILDKGDPGEVYNVGTGIPHTVLDVANAICEGTACVPEITGIVRTGDIRHCYADAWKLRDLGWEPKVRFEDGMAALKAWVATQKPELTLESLDKANMELERHGLLRGIDEPEPVEEQSSPDDILAGCDGLKVKVSVASLTSKES